MSIDTGRGDGAKSERMTTRLRHLIAGPDLVGMAEVQEMEQRYDVGASARVGY